MVPMILYKYKYFYEITIENKTLLIKIFIRTFFYEDYFKDWISKLLPWSNYYDHPTNDAESQFSG